VSFICGNTLFSSNHIYTDVSDGENDWQ